MEVIVSSGQVADNTVATKLIEGARRHHPDRHIHSASMDAAYDDTAIYQCCVQNGIHPIIALNPRKEKDSEFTLNQLLGLDQKGRFFCRRTGFPLLHNGTEPKRKGRMKLICPPTGERKQCPFRAQCCPGSKVGKTFYLYPLHDVRLLGTIPRGSEQWHRLMNTRSAVERTNSQLKSPTHKLDEPRVRGLEQIKIHVFLSVAALVVKTIGRKVCRLFCR